MGAAGTPPGRPPTSIPEWGNGMRASKPGPRRFPAPLRLFAAFVFAILALSAGWFAVTAPPPASASEPAAVARATTIHVLGQFNGWDESLWLSDPGMTEASPLVWVDSLAIFPRFIEAGVQEFKFVTDAAWGIPADYVLCVDSLHLYSPLDGPVCLDSDGFNLVMLATSAGSYEFALDETALWYTATLIELYSSEVSGRIELASREALLPVATIAVFAAGEALQLAAATSDAGDGSFSIPSLDGGTYDLAITATGYHATEVNGVVVADGGTIDIGPVLLVPGCTSAFSFIQVVGDFNGWDVGVPSMVQREPCVWVDTLDVAPGCHFMKFRTDNTWGNDYGSCTGEDPNCLTPLSGDICLEGNGPALGKLDFPGQGLYVFELNELTMTYDIHEVTTSVRSASWGSVKALYR